MHAFFKFLPGRETLRCIAMLVGCLHGPGGAQGLERAAGPFAERVLAAVNDYRGRHGLLPLRPSVALERIAAAHSQQMALQRRPSHGGFGERFERAGSNLCVENLAAGFSVPEQTVAGWRASPAHDRNLLEARARWVGVVSIDGYTTLFACDSDGAGSPAR